MASSEKTPPGMKENRQKAKLYYQTVVGQTILTIHTIHASCSKVSGNNFQHISNSHTLTDQCYHSLQSDATILVIHNR